MTQPEIVTITIKIIKNNEIKIILLFILSPNQLKSYTQLFVETDGATSISDVIRLAADVRETDFEEIENIVVENHRRFLLQEP